MWSLQHNCFYNATLTDKTSDDLITLVVCCQRSQKRPNTVEINNKTVKYTETALHDITGNYFFPSLIRQTSSGQNDQENVRVAIVNFSPEGCEMWLMRSVPTIPRARPAHTWRLLQALVTPSARLETVERLSTWSFGPDGEGQMWGISLAAQKNRTFVFPTASHGNKSCAVAENTNRLPRQLLCLTAGLCASREQEKLLLFCLNPTANS